MEERFIAACAAAREQSAALGVRIRPITDMTQARRVLAGHRESDGFSLLAQKDRLDLSLEALAIQKAYTKLFSDEQANNALMRLLDAGYRFR